MRSLRCVQTLLVIIPLLLLSACSGNSSSSTTPPSSQQSASVYTIGTDAPLPSIVSCELTVSGITIFNGTNNVSVFSDPQIVDFAQLSGLHQLLDLESVQPGTYTSATLTISNPVIGFIDTTQTPPVVNTINGTLSETSVTVNFASPFVVQNADLIGLRMEFDLRKSLMVDGTGQVTGQVNPVFEMSLHNASDSEVSIDEFYAGVTSVTGATTFNVQGPHGRAWSVGTNDNTVFDDPDDPISSYTTNTIVSLTGQLDPVSHDIMASEVQVVSTDGFFLGGLLTYVNPATGPATTVNLYVRDELPAINGISPGDITALALNGSENYRIGNIKLPLTTLLFNNSALAAGQRVGIGGMTATNNGATTLTV
ncbi:MAG: DUF4382 domain-containing protein, partial [Candidatus Acidiferrales bacterium]